MWKNLIGEFWGDLKTQKTRALLTLFAIGWGTLAVVLMLSFGEGLKRSVVEGEMGQGSSMLVFFGGETGKPFEGLPRGRDIQLHAEDLALLTRAIPEITLASTSYGRWGTQLKAGVISETTYMEGVDEAFGELRNMVPAPGGRFLNARDLADRRRVIFLGDSIARRLFPGVDPVGRTLLVDGMPFRVVGVMRKKRQTSSNNGPDAERAIIPASVFRTQYGAQRVGSLLIRPVSEEAAPGVKRRVYEVLGRRYQFDPTDERALDVWDMFEDLKMTTLITGGIEIFLGVVGALTLLVAGVGVANIMYVVVRERTREIGIHRAVGARRGHIIAQFVFEALLICLAGGLGGMTVAALLVWGVDAIPDTGNEAAAFLMNPKLSPLIALVTVGILVTVGLVAGLFPARRAASLDPVESLRYE
jgi:putative ABC transport system permease protein